MSKFSAEEILQRLVDSGMIDLTTVEQSIEQMERQKLLAQHKFRIWQSTDGRWYTNVIDSKSGKRRVIKRVSKADLEESLIEFYRGYSVEPTFENVFNEWIDSKTEFGEVQKQTIDRYVADYKRYIANTDIAKTKVKYLKEIDLEEFIKTTIHKQNLTYKNWSNLRILINGTMKYAYKHDYSEIRMKLFLDELEISQKAFKKVIKSDEEQVFTSSEEDMIKEYISSRPTCNTNLGILLAFETGLRVGELSTLKRSDIKGDVLSVTRTEIRTKDSKNHYVTSIREGTKGRDGFRSVILTHQAKDILNQIISRNPNSNYLLEENGQRIRGGNYTMKLRRMCKSLGITERSMHKVRKTYASTLLDGGVDEKIVQKQMGHTDINTTQKYYHFDKHESAEAIRQIEMAINGQRDNKGTMLKMAENL